MYKTLLHLLVSTDYCTVHKTKKYRGACMYKLLINYYDFYFKSLIKWNIPNLFYIFNYIFSQLLFIILL